MKARLLGSSVLLLLAGCSTWEHRPSSLIDKVEWVTDLPPDPNGIKQIDLDHEGALLHGFRIPSGTRGGGFAFRFHITGGPNKGTRVRYKLFYQNTSYKFPEVVRGGGQHPNAEENFYGSWEDAGEGFRITPVVSDTGLYITDRLCIQGDPREEERFLVDGVRHREGRNPRTGRYRFMLVAIDEGRFDQGVLPEQVQFIGRRSNGHFIEPFWFFLHGPGSRIPGVEVLVSDDVLLVTARPDPSRGIYANTGGGRERDAFCATCGDAKHLEANADWQQHFHHIDPSTRMENIPLVTSLADYTYEDYARNRTFTSGSSMVSILPSVSDTPCSTVRLDTLRNAIELRNPASTTGLLRKESVGVRTRNALTYGRYRVRCELPRLLNEHDIWNGLTNAIWLIGRDDKWSQRRKCDGGYLATYGGGPDDRRVERGDYAEIDFEILKGVPYCPQRSFPPNYAQAVADTTERAAWLTPLPTDVQALSGQLMVSCTNWDMACPQPTRFDVGCHPVKHEGRTFWNFRWDHGYRAITQKESAYDSEIFGRPYWFEIEWRPQDITWRIGPDLEHMRVVAYMDGSVTSIPDIPMRLVVTQEYHNTSWWAGSPYEQPFIPFSSHDHIGRILEVIID